MNAGNLDITMTADERELIKAQAKVMKQQDQMIEKYRKTFAESRKATRAASRELERFAQKTNRINMTPMQRYRQEVEMLRRALKAGLITQDTYNRAIQRAGQNLQSLGVVSNKTLIGMTGVLAGVAAATSAVADAMRQARAEIEKSKQGIIQSGDSLGQLMQLAQGDTAQERFADLNRMKRAAERTFAEGGAATLNDAYKAQFAIESLGFTEADRQQIAKMRSTQLISDPDLMLRGASTILTNFGKQEAGTASAVFSKLLMSARSSPANATEIANAVPQANPQLATKLKISDEEFLAALATTTTATNDPNRAATNLAAFLNSVDRSEYIDPAGKNLQQMVEAVSQQVAAGEDIRDILGDRKEAIQGFDTLVARAEAYKKTVSDIQRAERENFVNQQMALAARIPELNAIQTKRIAENEEAMARHLKGITGAEADAQASAIRREIFKRTGGNEGLDFAAKSAINFMRGESVSVFGMPINPNMVGGVVPFAAGGSVFNDEAFLNGLNSARTALKGFAEDLQQSSRTIQKSNINAMRANQARHGGGVEAQ